MFIISFYLKHDIYTDVLNIFSKTQFLIIYTIYHLFRTWYYKNQIYFFPGLNLPITNFFLYPIYQSCSQTAVTIDIRYPSIILCIMFNCGGIPKRRYLLLNNIKHVKSNSDFISLFITLFFIRYVLFIWLSAVCIIYTIRI